MPSFIETNFSGQLDLIISYCFAIARDINQKKMLAEADNISQALTEDSEDDTDSHETFSLQNDKRISAIISRSVLLMTCFTQYLRL